MIFPHKDIRNPIYLTDEECRERNINDDAFVDGLSDHLADKLEEV